MSNSSQFYKQLPRFSGFSPFTELDRFEPLPEDWYVIITDIQDSTAAIQQGLYKEVNSVSTASVVCAANEAEIAAINDGGWMPPSRSNK